MEHAQEHGVVFQHRQLSFRLGGDSQLELAAQHPSLPEASLHREEGGRQVSGRSTAWIPLGAGDDGVNTGRISPIGPVLGMVGSMYEYVYMCLSTCEHVYTFLWKPEVISQGILYLDFGLRISHRLRFC